MNIDKEFAPYQESFELKELGFDEPCLYHWHNSCKTHPFTNEICNPNCRPKTNSGIKDIGEENHVWSAPTFSQVFRWFREKYGLRIRNYGSMNYSGELSEYFEIFKYGYGTSDKSLSIEVGALTYEEAELACLRKLIQIVKEKTRISTN